MTVVGKGAVTVVLLAERTRAVRARNAWIFWGFSAGYCTVVCS